MHLSGRPRLGRGRIFPFAAAGILDPFDPAADFSRRNFNVINIFPRLFKMPAQTVHAFVQTADIFGQQPYLPPDDAGLFAHADVF